MAKLLFVVLTFFSLSCLAGGDSAAAKVISYKINTGGTITFEIEWIKENGLIADNKETSLLFDFHHWKSKSINFLFKFWLFFSDTPKNQYPKSKFDECVEFLKDKSNSKEVVRIGQMGSAQFKKNPENSKEIIVPYAEVEPDHSGVKTCWLYAAPI